MGTGGRDIEREEQREEGECPQAKSVLCEGMGSMLVRLGRRERKQLKEDMSFKTQASIHTQKGSGSAL